MFEAADASDLRRLMLSPQTSPSLCTYCGKDSREKWHGWRRVGSHHTIFACCPQQLIAAHQAKPEEITKQNLRGLFGDPREMLHSVLERS